jgi:hypothetical protein
LSDRLLSDDEFLGGSTATGGSSLLSDDEFLGDSEPSAPAARSAAPSGNFDGLVEQGNIDLSKRPVVENEDGSISTVRSMSFNIDGKEVLLPTVSPDGRILSGREAVQLYRKTGQHLGKFDSPEHATAYAESLHEAQDEFYSSKRQASGLLSDEEFVGGGAEPSAPTGRKPLPSLDDSWASNIERGIGERALDIGGGMARALGTGIEAAGDFMEQIIPLGRVTIGENGMPGWEPHTPESIAAQSEVGRTFSETATGLEDQSLGYKPGTTWEDFKESPISNFIPFAIEQGLVSIPDMYAAITNLPGYIVARSGEIAQTRAENDKRGEATVGDLLASLPTATVSALLERLGTSKILGLGEVAVEGLKQLPKAALKAGVTEGLTEAGQEGIEFTGETLGTETGFDPYQAAERMLAGAVGGMGFGATVRTGTGALEVAAGKPEGVPEGAAPAETLFGEESAGGVTAPSARGTPPPAPRPTDPEIDRPDSPRLTPADRASPLPNDLIDDGKKIFEDALGGKRGMAPRIDQQATIDIEMDAAAETSLLSPQAQPPASAATLGGPTTAGEAPRAPAGSPAGLPDHEFLTVGETNPEPTPGQAEAGNYAKRKVKVHGLDVSIETEAGGVRRSKPGAAEPWEVTMPAAYGYIRRTEGADGDQVDVYLGPQPSPTVFVIDQIDTDTRAFDEHKAMLDFPSREAALQAYEAAFSDGRGGERVGAVTEMPMLGFKSWLKSGNTKEALSYAGPAQSAVNQIPEAAVPGQPSAEIGQLPAELAAQAALKAKIAAKREAAPRTNYEEALKAEAKKVVRNLQRYTSEQRADRAASHRMGHRQRESTGEYFYSHPAIPGIAYPTRTAAAQEALRRADLPTEPAPIDVKPRKGPSVENKDIVQFIAAMGGIRDYKGELRSLDLSRKFVPGMGKLVRESGRDADKIREAASQEGYFDHIYGDPDTASAKSTVADLYRLIDQNERGQRAFSTQGQFGVEKKAAERAAVEDSEEQARRDDFDQTVKEFDLNDEERAEIEAAGRRGEWASEAIFDVLERRAIALDDETSESRTQKEPDFDAPFDTGPAEDTSEEAADEGGRRQGADVGEEARAAPGGGEPRQAERAGEAPEGGKGQGALEPFDPAQHIKLVADDIASLRKSDLERLFDEAPQTADAFDDLRVHLIESRPELAGAVMDAIEAVGMPARPSLDQRTPEEIASRNAERREKGQRIKDHVAAGGQITLPTMTRASIYKNADMIRVLNDGPRFQSGKGWVSVTDDQLNAMVAQLPTRALQSETVDTADGKREQTLIPGVKPVSTKEKLEAQAAKPMRAAAPQKDAGALFDMQARSERQDELFALRPDGNLIAAWQKHLSQLVSGAAKFANFVLLKQSPVLAAVIGGKGRVGLNTLRFRAIRSKHRDIPATVWAQLPNLIADPRFVYGRGDGTNTVALMAKLKDGSNIIVGLRDGEITTVTSWDNTDGESEARLAREIAAALERPGTIYAVSRAALDEILKLTGSDSRARPSSRSGLSHQGRVAKIVTREDVVKEAEGDERMKLRTTEAFQRQAEDVGTRLRAELDRLGLKDVGLRISDGIRSAATGKIVDAEGRYSNKVVDDADDPKGYRVERLIEVALNTDNPDSVLDHEAIHALRDVGALNPEWPILARKSGKEWVEKYNIAVTYGYLTRESQIEEGVAHAYADWKAGARMDGIITRAFKRIKAVLKGIALGFGKDFRTVEDVFEAIDSGKIGKRPRGRRPGRGDDAFGAAERAQMEFFQAAWHGTPHDFERFTVDKIGTGEGAQAFGWGLYFAGKKEIAEYYRDTLSQKPADVVGSYVEFVIRHGRPNGDGSTTRGYLESQGFPADAETISLIDRAIAGGSKGTAGSIDYTDDAVRAFSQLDTKLGKAGKLLKVNLPEDSELLLWDAPLSEQPKGVREKLTKAVLGRDLRDNEMDPLQIMENRTGQKIYDLIALERGQKPPADTLMAQVEPDRLIPDYQAASEALKAAGIPGHRYLAQNIGGGRALTDWEVREVKGQMGETRYQPTDKRTGNTDVAYATRELAEAAVEKKRDSFNYVIYDDAAVQVVERFKLKKAPKDQQESQQVMQGFIARGQPIDRAIRLPFEILGGLDEQGRWNPGKRVTGVIRDRIVNGKIDPKGRFGWLHGVAENVRRGLVDRYGLDPEYIEAEQRRALGQRGVLQKAEDILKVLSSANVSTNEANVLQSILTGEAVDDAAMTRLAVPIRQAIDDLGAEAVSLGLISAESYERNRGAYLHRVYLKNEVDQGTLAGWVSAKMASRRRRIIGDEMKGRGMFWDVPVDRLMRDVPDFQEGKRGTPNVGDKFRVIDEVSVSGDMLAGEESGKTLRRVYWPADKPTPDKYTGAAWRDRGEWEVRKAGKTTTLWRDYTKDERTKMGEIVDARYTIGKTFMLMANDLANGRFFKEIAENENWARSEPPATGWREAAEYGRFWNDPEIAWVKVPDSAIPDTGGKKRWGGLAGKFVRAEIWRDLNEIDIATKPGPWRKLLRQWKLNKTARNPVVHMNNIMSNLMFMDMADVRMQDLVAGIRAYAKGSKDFQEARDNGAFGADMMSQEIRDNVLKPLIEEIASQQQGGVANTFLARAGTLGQIADKLWTWAKTADNGMIRAYQAEDELFRMATYLRRRSQGERPATAAAHARDQFLNYDIRAPWVNAARNSVLPFISYTYRAVPKIAESIAHRPWKLAKYMAIAYAVNALAYLWDDGDDGEERERAALRDEEQGNTWLGTPRMLRMPWRDANGLPVFLDVRRWMPAGDVFDTNQGSSALPIPAPLQFGGPALLAFEFLLNRQAFTGKDITNDLTDDAADKAENVADWAWKAWAPSALWVPNSWYWEKMSNAINGATDTAGRAYSVPQAFLSSIGIKVRPLDVEDGLRWQAYDFKKVNDALRAAARSLARQRERNLISQEAFDSDMAKLTEKFGNLEADYKDFAERSQKKSK